MVSDSFCDLVGANGRNRVVFTGAGPRLVIISSGERTWSSIELETARPVTGFQNPQAPKLSDQIANFFPGPDTKFTLKTAKILRGAESTISRVFSGAFGYFLSNRGLGVVQREKKTTVQGYWIPVIGQVFLNHRG